MDDRGARRRHGHVPCRLGHGEAHVLLCRGDRVIDQGHGGLLLRRRGLGRAVGLDHLHARHIVDMLSGQLMAPPARCGQCERRGRGRRLSGSRHARHAGMATETSRQCARPLYVHKRDPEPDGVDDEQDGRHALWPPVGRHDHGADERPGEHHLGGEREPVEPHLRPIGATDSARREGLQAGQRQAEHGSDQHRGDEPGEVLVRHREHAARTAHPHHHVPHAAPPGPFVAA